MKNKKPKIVTIGGGTGQFTILSGLIKKDVELSAIVNMVDDGGSTGILRDELGALPPGDVRQCLVAMSNSSDLMRELFNYRFEKGSLEGHNFGNLLITAMEKIKGDFGSAVEEVSKILAISGNVIPVTTEDTVLCLKTKKGKKIKGQHKIDNSFFQENTGFTDLTLEPKANLNPKAKKAILSADIIIVGPGSFYTSIIPNLIVEGMAQALQKTKAKKVYISNLVNKPGQTDNYMAHHYVEEIENIIGSKIFDWVIYNNKRPDNETLALYEEEGGNLVWFLEKEFKSHYKLIATDILSKAKPPKRLAQDKLKRNLIRHNKNKIANLILKIHEENTVRKASRKTRTKIKKK
ncbi:YvcK family protein [bacterium]|nr:YvcK family protein [bacterium]